MSAVVIGTRYGNALDRRARLTARRRRTAASRQTRARSAPGGIGQRNRGGLASPGVCGRAVLSCAATLPSNAGARQRALLSRRRGEAPKIGPRPASRIAPAGLRCWFAGESRRRARDHLRKGARAESDLAATAIWPFRFWPINSGVSRGGLVRAMASWPARTRSFARPRSSSACQASDLQDLAHVGHARHLEVCTRPAFEVDASATMRAPRRTPIRGAARLGA